MNYTFPATQTDNYVKGTFTDSVGNAVKFEVPAVFNADGACDEAASLAAVNKTIESYNALEQRRISRGK